MRETVIELATLPMPFLYVMLAGLIAYRWSAWGRRLLVAGAVLLLVFSLQGVGKILAVPLYASVPGPEGRPAAVLAVVPTGGIYRDALGRWRSDPHSLRRLLLGRRVQREWGVALMIVGGVPIPGQPAEAAVVVREAGLTPADAVLEVQAATTWETGRAVAKALAGEPEERRRVILVTSVLHMLRMAASLRNAGVLVTGVPVEKVGLKRFEGLTDLMPGIRGIGLNRSVSRAYLGLMWYLVTGRIRFADLVADA